MTPILEIRHVTRRFAGLIAVNDVSFLLQPREILGVIGPNGAGKTTLISLISGTLAPSSGDILFDGQSLAGMPAYRRARLGIGRTFQIMRPFPGLSVLDNVAVGALFGHGEDTPSWRKPASRRALNWILSGSVSCRSTRGRVGRPWPQAAGTGKGPGDAAESFAVR